MVQLKLENSQLRETIERDHGEADSHRKSLEKQIEELEESVCFLGCLVVYSFIYLFDSFPCVADQSFF